MLKIGKGGVIDSLQMQKTVKPLLILRGILPQKQPLKSQQGLDTVHYTTVTCYSPPGRSISGNYTFLKQLFKSADHLLNKSGCGYVLGGVFSNFIHPRILQVLPSFREIQNGHYFISHFINL